MGQRIGIEGQIGTGKEGLAGVGVDAVGEVDAEEGVEELVCFVVTWQEVEDLGWN